MKGKVLCALKERSKVLTSIKHACIDQGAGVKRSLGSGKRNSIANSSTLQLNGATSVAAGCVVFENLNVLKTNYKSD